MIRCIKYLIAVFLILGLTINEGVNHAQINKGNHVQTTIVNARNKDHLIPTGIYLSSVKFLAKKTISNTSIALPYQATYYSAQINILINKQVELYHKIKSFNAEQHFVKKITTTSNLFSSLYMA